MFIAVVIHNNSQEVEATQMFINELISINKTWFTQEWSKFILKKEGNYDICYNMGES